VALPWFFADEKSDESDRLLADVYRDGAVVPVIWPIEVANALTMGFRRKRLSETDWLTSISTLAAIPVTVEPLDHPKVLSNLLPLSRRYNLTFYDAMYLELAERLSLPLATFDKDLNQAASLANVRLWSPA
jgi:predicted nucleic acid-binding protein